MSNPTVPGVYEFPCSGPIRAVAQIGAGALAVAAADQSSVVVTVAPGDDSEASARAAAQIMVRFDRDRVVIDTVRGGATWRFWRSGTVLVDVRLPMGSSLEAGVGAGSVRTDGQLGDTRIRIGSGKVQVDHVTADLVVKTGSGDVRADTVAGELSVVAGSGDVSVTSIGGPAKIQTASGAVRVGEARGALQVTTASGAIVVDAIRGDQAKITSVSGDLSVGVPTGTRAWLDLSTVSGTIVNDLRTTEGEEAAALNLRLKTVSGDIAIRRVDNPAA